MADITLTSDEQRRVVRAIARAVRGLFEAQNPPKIPRYPDSLPELERHVHDLVEIVRTTDPATRAVQIIKRSCSNCPHQFPGRYCPLRPQGGCAVFRYAGEIAQAVALALPEMNKGG